MAMVRGDGVAKVIVTNSFTLDFVESDDESVPYSRNRRSVAYSRAKNMRLP